MKTSLKKYATDEELDTPINWDYIAKQKTLTRAQEKALGIPTPEQLAGKQPQEKITLAVNKDALDFFKREAKRLGTSYQRMVRNLLSEYAKRHAH